MTPAIRDSMKKEDAEEFTQALGQVVAGSYRQIALAKNLGVPKALGLSLEQWVQTRLGGYVRLSIPERREAVKELTSNGMSQREVAEVLGVDHKTIHHDLKLGENSPKKVILKPESGENSPLPQTIDPVKTDTNVSKRAKVNSIIPTTEQEKEAARIQAEKQSREIAAEHLFYIIGTLGLGKQTPAERAVGVLDYDQEYFKSYQIKITKELWATSIETLKECTKQWESRQCQHRIKLSSKS